MSAVVKTPACFPENDRYLNSWGWADEPVANHEACSGGFNMPGVLGGWTCPCECHREAKT